MKRSNKTQFAVEVTSQSSKFFLDKISTHIKETTYQNYTGSLVEQICLGGNHEDIQNLLSKEVLQRLKKKIVISLIRNLYEKQDYQNGEYLHDQNFAAFITKATGYAIKKPDKTLISINYRLHFKEKWVKCEFKYDDLQKSQTLLKSDRIYTKSLATLHKLAQGEKMIPQEIKRDFLALLEFIQEPCKNDHLYLFFDYMRFIQKIGNDVLDRILKISDCFKNSPQHSQNLAVFLIKLEKYKEAKDFTDFSIQAIENCKNAKVSTNYSNEQLVEIEENNIFNLATIYFGLDNTEEAYIYFKKYFDLGPSRGGHTEAGKILVKFCYRLGYTKEADDLARTLNFDVEYLSIMEKIIKNINYPTFISLKEFSFTNQADLLLTSLQYSYIRQDEEKTRKYKELINKHIIHNTQYNTLIPFSKALVQALLNTQEPVKVKTHIDECKIRSESKSEILFIMALVHSDAGNYKIASIYIKFALDYEPDNFKFILQAKLLSNRISIDDEKILRNQALIEEEKEDKVKEDEILKVDEGTKYTHDINEIKLKSELSETIGDKTLHDEKFLPLLKSGSSCQVLTAPKNNSKIGRIPQKEVSPFEYINNYINKHNITDAKQIESYFKEAKTTFKDKGLNNKSDDLGWDSPLLKVKVCYAKAIKILPHLFAAIDRKIQNKHDEYIIDQWAKGLEKGFVSNSLRPGIKHLPNGLYELKGFGEKGDSRLLCDTTFTNTEGDDLMLFDTISDHTNLQDYINTHSANVIGCLS